MRQSRTGAWVAVGVAGALCAALAEPVGAQESIFGSLGFGLPEEGLSVRSRAMGNASVALPGIQFSFRNPASLAVFDRTGISIASLLQTRTSEDRSGESTQNSAEVPFIQLAFPLGHGFVLGGGYYRYLDFDGAVDTFTSFGGDSLPTQLSTAGGVSVLTPQLARWFSPALRVGAGVDFYTGSRERRRLVELDPGRGVSTQDSLGFGLGGIGWSAGVQGAPVPGLLLGVAYRSGVTLDGDLEFAPGFAADGGADPGELRREVEVELPASFAGGASFRVTSRLLIAGQIELSRWGDFALDGEGDPAYDDALAGGAGVELSFPDRLLFLPRGTVLRAGAHTRELPRRFGGEPVRERAVTVGLGQLVGIGATNLDLSLEAGKRGDLQENGLEEPYVRLGIALSAYEQWIGRTPRTP